MCLVPSSLKSYQIKNILIAPPVVTAVTCCSQSYLTRVPTISICGTPLYFPASDTNMSMRSRAGMSVHCPTVDSGVSLDAVLNASLWQHKKEVC